MTTIFFKGENLKNMVISVRKVKGKKFVLKSKNFRIKVIDLYRSVKKNFKQIWEKFYKILKGGVSKEYEYQHQKDQMQLIPVVELAIKSLLKSRKSTIGFLRKSVFSKPQFWVFEKFLILVRDFYFDFSCFKNWCLKRSDLYFFIFPKNTCFQKYLRYTFEKTTCTHQKKKPVFFWTPLTIILQ